MMTRALLLRLTPILGALGLAVAPIMQLDETLVYFDFLTPFNQWILFNYIATGFGVGIAFVLLFHVAMQNHTFSRRDVFFILAGPAMGIFMSLTGATQFDVMKYTLVMNLGLGGLKEMLKKITGIDFNGMTMTADLTAIPLTDIKAEIERRTRGG
jgi:hypothetical protein